MFIKLISIYLFMGVIFLSFMFVNSYIKGGKASYAKAFGALSLTLQFYLFGYLMELNSATLSEMLFWNQIQYIGIPFFPGFWLIVSMLYTGKKEYLKGFYIFLIFLIPILNFILHLTNEYHHLFYSDVKLQHIIGEELLLISKGPAYVLQMVYVLVALILCSYFYLKRYKNSFGDEKIQFRILLIASILPYLALVLVGLNIGGIGLDYTALILPPCIYLINIALTRYNFLDIKVLARERVFENSSSGLILLNRMNQVVDFNKAGIAFFKLFGYQLSNNSLEIILKNDSELIDTMLNSKDKTIHITLTGEDKYINIKAQEIKNKNYITGQLITLSDVTETEILRHRLVKMANTDELSGLNNRRNFRELSERAFEVSIKNNEPISVLMMDIDYFKKINDNYGHLVGDSVIIEFSKILLKTFKKPHIIGRMGGEEFAVVMINTDINEAFQVAEFLRKSFEKTDIIFDGITSNATVSIGISGTDKSNKSFDSMLNNADKALYQAKNSGRNRCQIF